MGCACGKGGGGQSIRQAHQQRQSKLPLGASRDAALQLGDSDGVIRRVRVVKAGDGLRPNAAVWVTGTRVETLLAAGSVVDITRTQQRARQWKVGPYTYSDKGEANRVGALKGITPIEVA